MIEKTRAFIEKHSLIKPQSTVIVGLSGGPDSVCLLHLLSSFPITLIAAHLDHEWRVNSADDALFCKQFAQRLGISFVEAKASQISTKKYNGSQEARGRELRRTFFEKIAHDHKADAIALGHHANDQQETFFLRLIRGSSLAGLAGMKAQEGLYIRPLLEVHKHEIYEYIKKHGLSYVVDSTNDSDLFLRNALRLKALPALRECDARFDKNFERTHALLQETHAFIARVTQQAFDECMDVHDGQKRLSLDKFLSLDPFLFHPIILAWLCDAHVPFTPTTAFFDEILRFLKNSGSQHSFAQWSIIKAADYVYIKSKD